LIESQLCNVNGPISFSSVLEEVVDLVHVFDFSLPQLNLTNLIRFPFWLPDNAVLLLVRAIHILDDNMDVVGLLCGVIHS